MERLNKGTTLYPLIFCLDGDVGTKQGSSAVALDP